MLQTQLPTKKEHIQRKFEVVLKELKINPAELRPTERIVGMYHQFLNETLKYFAMMNYIKKKREELGKIQDAKVEKLSYLKLPYA